jgi:tRNA modification GTPase
MFSTTDTIAAIATPAGRGGIGIVRVSGPAATAIACALLGRSQPFEPRRATFARLRLDGGQALSDHVVVTAFPAPHSYTTEDTVEISAHGSPVVLAGLLDACVRHGARLARPGEFTFRAFLHGRIDLTQAEAVADLVDAVTPLQARTAFDQLEGSLATAIRRVGDALLDLMARAEASLDFPEEGYHFIEPGELAARVQSISRDVRAILARADEGRVIREGVRVVLSGPVNAGKSSLFNRLADMDRAIVSASPGTTRDLLIERVDIGGVPVTLVDTAGLRASSDEVEAEGVRRAERAAEGAAVTVLVLDRSVPLAGADRQLLGRAAQGCSVIVANKADLPAAWTARDAGVADIVYTSAYTGDGLNALRDAVRAALGRRSEQDEPPLVTNARHVSLLEEANRILNDVLNDLNQPAEPPPEEVVIQSLAAARAALDEVSGVQTTEDILTHIFTRFCIGK